MHPVIRRTMNCRRFETINRAFACSEDRERDVAPARRQDRLSKLRDCIDHLEQSFRTAYDPGQELSFDESMIKWKGQSLMRVRMPHKPIKEGQKNVLRFRLK